MSYNLKLHKIFKKSNFQNINYHVNTNHVSGIFLGGQRSKKNLKVTSFIKKNKINKIKNWLIYYFFQWDKLRTNTILVCSPHTQLWLRAFACNWMMAMICALILLTPNFCDDQLRWNSHRSPRLTLMEDFSTVVLHTHSKEGTGKPDWRREELLEGALALIREQAERVRTEQAGLRLIWERKVLSTWWAALDGDDP